MSIEAIKHLFITGDKIFLSHSEVHEAREDTLLLADAIQTEPTDVVLEIGVGLGVAAVFIGQKVKEFYGVDINKNAVMSTIVNGYLNDVDFKDNIFVGDCYEPFSNKKFDIIYSNPPQLPTPQSKERNNWIGWANNGGNLGRDVIDKIINDVDKHLNPGGSLYLMHFEICNLETTVKVLEDKQLKVEIVNSIENQLGKLSFERIDHITNCACDMLKKDGDNYYHKIFIIKATKVA
ncbi:MAG: methylase [Massilibacillus sp.]|jgi:release factor glutamine methyltransferase|nr:methylase [Massilibacillus sp.]